MNNSNFSERDQKLIESGFIRNLDISKEMDISIQIVAIHKSDDSYEEKKKKLDLLLDKS